MAGGAFSASVYLLEDHVRAGRGDAVAVRCPEGSLTYGELLDRVARAAGGLRDLGVRREDRVLLVMFDGPGWLVSFLAALRIGAIPVPVNTMLTDGDLMQLALDARPRAAIVSGANATIPSFLAQVPWLRHVVVDGPVASRDAWAEQGVAHELHRFGDLLDSSPVTSEMMPIDAPGFWLYTSGTTGTPRAAMHRQVDLRVTAEAFGKHVLGVRPDDVAYSVSKLFFAYGLGNSLTFPLSAGASVVLDDKPAKPERAGEVLAKERPTLFYAVPRFYASLLAAGLPRDTFSSVRIAVSAGEALPAEIFRRFRDRFGVEIVDGLGSTETLHTYLSNRPGAVRPGTCGTAVPGYEVRILDRHGSPVPVGRPGELFVRGASIATGYWNDPDTTRRTFDAGWLRTGDVACCSPEGVVTHLGRANDMLKAGGIWVSPSEVEAALVGHPEIVEAAVVGQRDTDGIERLVAYVVAQGDAPSEAELSSFARRHLAPFKRPECFVVVPELPKTATGKVRRALLRNEPFSVGAGARSSV